MAAKMSHSKAQLKSLPDLVDIYTQVGTVSASKTTVVTVKIINGCSLGFVSVKNSR